MSRWRYLPALGVTALLACGDARPPDRSSAESAPGSSAAGGATGGRIVPAGSTPMEITASLGNQSLTAKGPGECEHAGEGSIYQRPAAQWSARFSAGQGEQIRHLNLTFWREASGPESFNLALSTGSGVHRIATVEGGERHGRGTARLEGGPEAGTIVVEGTTADGEALRVRVRCERFTPLVAEGG